MICLGLIASGKFRAILCNYLTLVLTQDLKWKKRKFPRFPNLLQAKNSNYNQKMGILKYFLSHQMLTAVATQ